MLYIRRSLILIICSMCMFDVYAACVVTGCNDELCLKAGECGFSTCLWKAEYTCYKQLGICEEDANGMCGWKQTDVLVTCVNSAHAIVEAGDISSD